MLSELDNIYQSLLKANHVSESEYIVMFSIKELGNSTGIIVSIGLAIHNFPEGLAIGSGFGASIKLGISPAIAICLHDIPEGRFQIRTLRNMVLCIERII